MDEKIVRMRGSGIGGTVSQSVQSKSTKDLLHHLWKGQPEAIFYRPADPSTRYACIMDTE